MMIGGPHLLAGEREKEWGGGELGQIGRAGPARAGGREGEGGGLLRWAEGRGRKETAHWPFSILFSFFFSPDFLFYI